jgi:hypothetical protein
MTTSSLMDATKITSRLWVGGRWVDRLSISANSIHHIALCARECQPSLQNWPVGITRGNLDDIKMTERLSAEALLLGRAVAGAMMKGSVLVTCNRGLNRAPLVSAIALQIYEGMSAECAVALICNSREGSFSNSSFKYWLLGAGIEITSLRQGENEELTFHNNRNLVQ